MLNFLQSRILQKFPPVGSVLPWVERKKERERNQQPTDNREMENEMKTIVNN